MIKYIDLLKNMENFHKIDGVVMIKTERYNNNFNFYIETSKGWLFNIEKRENDVKCYAENKEKGNHFVINVNSVDSLLSTIDNYSEKYVKNYDLYVEKLMQENKKCDIDLTKC